MRCPPFGVVVEDTWRAFAILGPWPKASGSYRLLLAGFVLDERRCVGFTGVGDDSSSLLMVHDSFVCADCGIILLEKTSVMVGGRG
jgi:hypothetical protein